MSYMEKLNRYNVISIFLLIIIIYLFHQFAFDYRIKQVKLTINSDIQLLKLLLKEKKEQLTGYTKIMARFPDLLNLNNSNLYTRKILAMQSELSLKGIYIYDNNLNSIFKTGLEMNFVKDSRITNSIYKLVQDGYTTAFFSETDLSDIQITAVSGIYDEYNIGVIGIVVLNDLVNREDFHLLAQKNNIIIEYFKKSKLERNNKILLEKMQGFEGKDYYIERKKINNRKYLIGYIPVRGFYNNVIGYFTILKAENISYDYINTILIFSIFLFLMIYIKRITSNFKSDNIQL